MNDRLQNLGVILISLVPMMGWINHPTALIGHPGAEVYGHAWSWWWRTKGWPLINQGTELAVGVSDFPAIDMLPMLALGWMAKWGSPVIAHNAWVIVCSLLAAYGGKKLAESVNGHPLFGAMAVAWSAPLLGSYSSGLTEDMALGFSALALAAAPHNLRIAALWAALSVWSGLVLGWLTACLVLTYAIGLRWRHWTELIKAITALGCLCTPLLWLHWSRLNGEGHRSGEHVLGAEPMWSLNPWKQADIASFMVPQSVDLSALILRTHPGYLGLTILLLCLLGARKHWKLLLISLLFIGLSMGPTLRWMGSEIGLRNPLWWLWQWVPGAELLNHHARAIPIALLPLVAVASRQVYRLKELQQPWMLLLLGTELCLLSPMGLFLPSAPAHHSPMLESLETQNGRWLHLPMGGPGRSFQLPLWLQQQHQQPLWLWPNRPGLPPGAPSNETVQWMIQQPSSKPPPLRKCLPIGITGVIAEKQIANDLALVLGKPQRSDEQWSIWASPVQCD